MSTVRNFEVYGTNLTLLEYELKENMQTMYDWIL